MASVTATSQLVCNPATKRAASAGLCYDKRGNRLVYPVGKTVVLRSLAGTDHWVYKGHNAAVSAARISPSGYYVASGDESGWVHVWDCSQDSMIMKSQFQVLSGRINDLVWDADSQRIIAVGQGSDKFGHAFSFDSGNSLGEISGHSSQVNSVDIRQVRPYRAVAVGDDSNLVFYQGPPFKFASSEKTVHNNFIKGVKFSPDGKYIVSVGVDRVVGVYDGKEGTKIKTIEGLSKGGIYSIDWIDNEKFLIASADAKLRSVNVESGEIVQEWELESKVENQFLGCCVAGEFIVGVTLGGVIYLYKKAESAPVEVIYGHQGSITALAQSDKGVLVSGSFDGSVLEWNGPKAKPVQGDKHTGLIIKSFISNGKTYTISYDDTLNVLENCESKKLISFETQPLDVKVIEDKIYVLFESQMVVYKDDGTVLKEHKLIYDASSFDVSSKYVIITDAKSFKVNIYSADEFKLVNDSNVLRARPVLTRISPYDEFVAIGDSTGKILLYSLGSEFKVVTSRWAFHTARINSISWHPDGKYIVSGSLDTNIIIFSVEKPAKTIKSLNAHKEGVNVVQWVSGEEIVSGGSDGIIRKWQVKWE